MVPLIQTAHAYETLPPIKLSQHPEMNQDWFDYRNPGLNATLTLCFKTSFIPFASDNIIPACLKGAHQVQDQLCSNPEVYQKIDACKDGKIQLYLDTFGNTNLDNP